ncbi:MAG: hypothetical protein GQ573_01765 [Gammaproteobacteria bacterium]|nr:hypothetical protein [Gammaproteobacteria bacterium]
MSCLSEGVNNMFLRYLLQAFNYTIFMALIWYFATSPSVRVIEDDEAMITVAFGHAGETRAECRRLSQEELMKLPPNMRKAEDCPRERSPIIIEAMLDGEVIYSVTRLPPGIFNDGGVNIYYNSKVPAGKHTFEIKMDDSVRKEGFNYQLTQDIDIKPAQILLVEFDSLTGFVIK